MQYKTTTRLFKGIYKYKIVLVCPGAQHFRYHSHEEIVTHLLADTKSRTKENLQFALALQNTLNTMENIEVRVENPWISIYTNNESDLNKIAKTGQDCVKYISKPSIDLEEGTVLMPKMDYDFRVTLGKTTHEHSAFIEWAESNTKIRLTKGCVKDLEKPRSWGGKHFYVKGDKNLMVAKMHLEGAVSKVERIVKNQTS
jgi:hypothetical protein